MRRQSKKMLAALLTVAAALSVTVTGTVSGTDSGIRSCETIRIEQCRGLGYNVTGMPNLVGHELQQDADLLLQTFTPLIQYGCSSQLRFFLCSVYVPMCTEKVALPIGPCRPLCETVRSRCQPILQEFGFPWPSALNCSKFPPVNNQKHMCMDGPGEVDEPSRVDSHYLHRTPPGGAAAGGATGGQRRFGQKNRVPPHINNNSPSFPSSSASYGADDVVGMDGIAVEGCSHLSNSDKFVYLNRTGRCAQHCDADVVFTGNQKDFAEIWLAVWTWLCFASTLFTGVTFLIDSGRFKYPERPVIFVAICYNVYSIGYIVRLVAGRRDIACHLDPTAHQWVLVHEGLGGADCAIVFLLLYYFGTAAGTWWLMLTLIWYLAVGRGWSHDALRRKSTYFHVCAWALPAAQTIVVLVMRVVDADELTGTCFVGNQSSENLFGFVIAPMLVYLVVGIIFLASGFAAVFRGRSCKSSVVRSASSSTSAMVAGRPVVSKSGGGQGQGRGGKKHALLLRVGIYCALFTAPAVCVVASYWYEYVVRVRWFQADGQPTVQVFMLRIFMSLAVGITSAMWVWSSKTLDSWRRAWRCLVRSSNKSKRPQYLQNPALVTKQNFVVVMNTQRNKKANGKCGVLTDRRGSETAV